MLLLVVACAGDPVHDEAVAALGSERRGVREGPNHRPGQPCRTCHGGQGPGDPEFVIAGTVFLARDLREPLSGSRIEVTDATGAVRGTTSNEVGNFYIGRDSWSPVFPVTVLLRDPRTEENGVKKMETPMQRNGDCASCHYGEDNQPGHMPPVFLRTKAKTP